jgi:hypothetical protein
MSTEEARVRLAVMQTELVRTLTGQGGASNGLQGARLQATARALRTKRARAVARAWPGLAGDLGDRFAERFAAFAAGTLLPHNGGAVADGRAFARWLARSGELGERGRLEAMAVDLRYAARSDGLVPRKAPAVRMMMLSRPRRLVAACRLPWIGERWFVIARRSWLVYRMGQLG